MTFKLAELPYKPDSLEPAISRETLDYHYNKHHAGYVKKLNDLVKDTSYENMSLKEVIKASEPGENIFNNAAQVWNHTFYWNSMTPGNSRPSKELGNQIDNSFGNMENLRQKFMEAASGQFGSGWAWLISNGDRSLSVVTTLNADTPIRQNFEPLIVCDVWEHAYYIDYRNERPEYLAAFWELLNWDFADINFQK